MALTEYRSARNRQLNRFLSIISMLQNDFEHYRDHLDELAEALKAYYNDIHEGVEAEQYHTHAVNEAYNTINTRLRKVKPDKKVFRDMSEPNKYIFEQLDIRAEKEYYHDDMDGITLYDITGTSSFDPKWHDYHGPIWVSGRVFDNDELWREKIVTPTDFYRTDDHAFLAYTDDTYVIPNNRVNYVSNGTNNQSRNQNISVNSASDNNSRNQSNISVSSASANNSRNQSNISVSSMNSASGNNSNTSVSSVTSASNNPNKRKPKKKSFTRQKPKASTRRNSLSGNNSGNNSNNKSKSSRRSRRPKPKYPTRRATSPVPTGMVRRRTHKRNQ